MQTENRNISSLLFENSDAGYKAFQCSIVPTVAPETVIGVRSPVLHRIAKSIAASPEADDFMRGLPHRYYDENILHCYLIGHIKSFDGAVCATESFLPYIDNWAVCDALNPKPFAANKSLLMPYIDRWLLSDRLYTVRFAVRMLMNHYIGDEGCFEKVNAVKLRGYYIDMMIAWFFATALAADWDGALPYVVNQPDPFIRAKTIRKAIESRRITEEQKDFLRKI